MATKSKFTVKHGLAVNTQSGTTALLNYPTADGTNNQLIKTDGSGNLSFDSAVSSFINLTDTPVNYTSSANNFLRVDSTGTAVEFSDVTVTSNVSRESFTASGDSNVITLANTYVGSNYVLIFVDGVIQFPTTNFTLDSTVLTFTATPDSAARIEVFGTSGNLITVPGDTTVSAAKLTNPLALPDNHKITFGNGSDLQIYHDGSKNIISGTVNHVSADSVSIPVNGMVHFGGDSTTHGNIFHDSDYWLLKNQHGHVRFVNYALGKSIYLQGDNGSGTIMTIAYCDGSTGNFQINHTGNKKFNTTSTGAEITGILNVSDDVVFDSSGAILFDKSDKALEFGDNYKAKFGAGGDLWVYHTPNENYIQSINGNINILQSDIDGDIKLWSDNGSGSPTTYIVADGGTGEVQLSHYGTEKLATKSTGVTVSGIIISDQAGGTTTLDANGHITGHQKLNAVTAGGRITGTTNQGDMARIDLSQAKAGTNGGYLSLQTANTSGTLTEHMRIDSAGNVGIGTLPIALTGNHFVNSLSIASNGPYILMQDENNANKMRYIANNGGAFQFGTVNDDGSTSKTEHMRIDSHGMVGIGNYSSLGPVDRFEVKGDSASYVAKIGGPEVYARYYASGASNTVAVYADGDTPGSKNHIYSMGVGGYDKIKISGTTTTAHVWIANGLNVGDLSNTAADNEIRATGNITAYYSSDERLKENIVPLKNAIDKINSIRGVEFDWTDEDIEKRGGEDGYFVRKHDIGVIAQEVEKVLPEVVRDRDDGYKAVQYEKMVPLLIQAIKEQQIQIDELKEKINAVTG